MQSSEKPLSPQDAVESFDRLQAGRVAFRFASESEADQWEQDGRVDELRESAFDIGGFSER